MPDYSRYSYQVNNLPHLAHGWKFGAGCTCGAVITAPSSSKLYRRVAEHIADHRDRGDSIISIV